MLFSNIIIERSNTKKGRRTRFLSVLINYDLCKINNKLTSDVFDDDAEQNVLFLLLQQVQLSFISDNLRYRRSFPKDFKKFPIISKIFKKATRNMNGIN